MAKKKKTNRKHRSHRVIYVTIYVDSFNVPSYAYYSLPLRSSCAEPNIVRYCSSRFPIATVWRCDCDRMHMFRAHTITHKSNTHTFGCISPKFCNVVRLHGSFFADTVASQSYHILHNFLLPPPFPFNSCH